jgi:hypothetical protein
MQETRPDEGGTNLAPAGVFRLFERAKALSLHAIGHGLGRARVWCFRITVPQAVAACSRSQPPPAAAHRPRDLQPVGWPWQKLGVARHRHTARKPPERGAASRRSSRAASLIELPRGVPSSVHNSAILCLSSGVAYSADGFRPALMIGHASS